MGDSRLVGLAEASRLTQISRERIRQLINKGEVQGAERVGNAIGIPWEEVEKLKIRGKRRGGWPKGKPRKPSPGTD